MIEKVIYNNEEYAIILRNSYNKPGISFFTPSEYSQQLAYMQHSSGKIIEPHFHNKVKRQVHYTLEVLLIKKGVLQVDFYNDNQEYIESKTLEQGDLILLIKGGHGFEIIKDVEMIEIKQGPFVGDKDKTRFHPVREHSVSTL
jgi:hypothetical protein